LSSSRPAFAKVAAGLLAAALAALFVPVAAEADVYDVVDRWGGTGNGNGQFVAISSVAVAPAGDVYVSDGGPLLIQRFASDGTFIAKWGGEGEGDGKFKAADGVDIDSGGNVYVADHILHRILKFAPDGKFLTKWGSDGKGPTEFQKVIDVSVGPNDEIYAVDAIGVSVKRFTPSGGFLGMSSVSVGPGREHPWTVAVDPGGAMFVADSATRSIRKFSPAGALLAQWGGIGTGDSEFGNAITGPSGLDVDGAGNVYVADSNNNMVKKFSADGAFITAWRLRGTQLEQDHFSPVDVDVDGIGNVYVADSGNDEILKLVPGAPTVTITKRPHKHTVDKRLQFEFAGSYGGAFECSIDGGPWAPCVSGQDFGRLGPGDHEFRVRQTVDGRTSPIVAYRWTIDIPKSCLLRSARARLFVYERQHRIRLVIHYASWRPNTDVRVSYRMVGRRGGLYLGDFGAPFRKEGVIRERVGKSAEEMAKIRAAKKFLVTFRVSGASAQCIRYYKKELTIRKTVAKQTVWFQADSVFAPGGGSK
jgi:DNA-binding beta-propeller fold protein YncE